MREKELMLPSLDSLNRHLLSWDIHDVESHPDRLEGVALLCHVYFDTAGYPDELQALKNSYKSINEYKAHFYPLLLEELRAVIQRVHLLRLFLFFHRVGKRRILRLGEESSIGGASYINRESSSFLNS